MYMKVVARVTSPNGKVFETTINVRRPCWDHVYNGYPLQFRGTDNEKDETSETVFKSVLGEQYDRNTFKNACATRVSIALINARVKVRKDFLVQVGDHAGKGFIASASELQKWLSDSETWGNADITIDKNDKNKYHGKTNLEIIRKKLNGKTGVYIILGGFKNGVTGHATLWTGNNVIGGKDDDAEDGTYSDNIDNGATVYFWELKGFSSAKETYVEDDQIVEVYWSYGESYTRLQDKVEGEEDDILWTKYYEDLNLHVETKDGNDGKKVKITIKSFDDDLLLSDENNELILCDTIHKNSVLVEKVFKKYTLNH